MATSLKSYATTILSLLFAFLLLTLFQTASVQAAPQPPDLDKQRRAESLTQSLHKLGQAYEHASPKARQQALTRLQKVAVERYELLVDLIENQPGTLSRVALPNSVRNALPEELQALVEQRVQAQGELETLYEDYEDGTHKLRYYLKVEDKIVSLHFKDHPPHLLSGQSVSVNGLYLGFEMEKQKSHGTKGAIILDSGDNLLLLGDSLTTTETTSSTTSSVEVLPNTMGQQRTLVLAINFADNSSEPWTLDFLASRFFGDVNAWYQESSYGQTSLAGDVHGYYTLPINTTCSALDISSYADTAAKGDGIDVLSYDRIIYVYPQVTSCGWGGKGTVGGSPSRAYLNGKVTTDLAVHEIGHNFGLYHSHGIGCDSAPIEDNCTVYEYGDIFDAMGDRSYYHFNAFQKERLGWLTDQAGDIVTVNDSGSFFVEPYQTSPGNYPKVLKIIRDAQQANWYYLEYRQAIGFDSALEGNENILNGLLFHNASPLDGNSSLLLDMTTGTSSIDDPALAYGNSYTDPNTGITITTGLPGNIGIYADISSGQQSCVRSTPLISFLSSESAWVTAGTDVNYSLTVTNNDSSACDVSTFNLGVELLAEGWTGTFSQTSIDLSPGQSASVTLTVTSVTDAIDGFYDFVASASSSSSGTGLDTGTYIIENTSTNEAPVATDDNVILEQESTVTITVLANDYDPDEDHIVIDSVTQGKKGTVTLNPDNTVTYIPAKSFKDSDSFNYSIIDGEGGTAVATVFIALQASSDTKPDGGGGDNPNKGKGKPSK